jgi:hypothetical protein
MPDVQQCARRAHLLDVHRFLLSSTRILHHRQECCFLDGRRRTRRSTRRTRSSSSVSAMSIIFVDTRIPYRYVGRLLLLLLATRALDQKNDGPTTSHHDTQPCWVRTTVRSMMRLVYMQCRIYMLYLGDTVVVIGG